jgi:hypothetical protein
MQAIINKIRFSVTLLITCLMMLIFCFDSPAQAVRIKGKKKFKTTDEIVLPWTFQAAIDERIDDSDDEYHGLRFSLSHFFSGSNALRFSMRVGESDQTFDDVKTFHSDGRLYTFENYRDFDVSSVTFSLQSMFYTSPKRESRLYWGLGPRLGISETNPNVLVSYHGDFYPDWAEWAEYDNGTLVSFGLEGSIGFEWFLGSNISMLAEYGIAVQKEWYIFEFDYYDYYGHHVNEVESFDDGIHVDASHIQLGVAVYF